MSARTSSFEPATPVVASAFEAFEVDERTAMSGRSRLPGGEVRKASQKRARRVVGAPPVRIEIPWHPGDRVRWRDRGGLYRREVDEENAFIEIEGRLYRVRRAELRPG